VVVVELIDAPTMIASPGAVPVVTGMAIALVLTTLVAEPMAYGVGIYRTPRSRATRR